MPKFRVEETVPCLVTWRCEIEAVSEDDAREKFINGERGASGESEPIIGDSLDNYSLTSDMLEITRLEG